MEFGLFYNTGYYGTDPDQMIALARHAEQCGFESFYGEFFSFTRLCSYPKPLGPLPVHVGGSSRAAARRAGLRGDGYFPGGGLTEAERAGQVDLMRATARAAGRDPGALEYTRWGSIDMTGEAVSGHAGQGVTRLIVSPASKDPSEQRDQVTAFADRLGLAG